MEHAGRPQSGVTVNLEVNMKTAFGFLLVVVLCLAVIADEAAYTYDKKPISKEQFDNLYQKYKDKAFADRDGNVFFLSLTDKAYPKIGDCFFVTGTPQKMETGAALVTYSTKAELRIYPTNPGRGIYATKHLINDTALPTLDFHIRISNPDYKIISLGNSGTFPILITGVYDEKGRKYFAELLKPASREDFAKLIANKPLVELKRKIIPGKYEKCSYCMGSGTMRDPTKTSRMIQCDHCFGFKTLVKTPDKIEYTETAIEVDKP